MPKRGLRPPSYRKPVSVADDGGRALELGNMKVVYNADYGGFHLTALACALTGRGAFDDHNRADPLLVWVVECLGSAAGKHLRIADVPKGQRYRIDEYDGLERVMTVDDYDWEVAS